MSMRCEHGCERVYSCPNCDTIGITPEIDFFLAKLAAAESEIAALKAERDELDRQSANWHSRCACAVDGPNDVCLVHTPHLNAAREEIAALKVRSERADAAVRIAEAFVVWVGMPYEPHESALRGWRDMFRAALAPDSPAEPKPSVRALATALGIDAPKMSEADVLGVAARPDPMQSLVEETGRLGLYDPPVTQPTEQPCEACGGRGKTHALGDSYRCARCNGSGSGKRSGGAA